MEDLFADIEKETLNAHLPFSLKKTGVHQSCHINQICAHNISHIKYSHDIDRR